MLHRESWSYVHPAPHNERNRQILSAIVRAYIETGEPVSSRSISRRHAESLSPATIRNVMSDLEEQGFLYQPHTSAGRVPTATAYRFFAQQVAAQATLSQEDEEWIRGEFAAAITREEIAERAGHVLAEISRGLGIVVSPPICQDRAGTRALRSVTGWARRRGSGFDRRQHARQNYSPGARFSQPDLDRTADYLNRHYVGRTLEAIRADLLGAAGQGTGAIRLCWRAMRWRCAIRACWSRARRSAFTSKAPRRWRPPRNLTIRRNCAKCSSAIEEKHRLIALLAGCIDTPDPVHVQIGVQGHRSGGRTSGLDQRAVFVSRSIAGNRGSSGPDAHAL